MKTEEFSQYARLLDLKGLTTEKHHNVQLNYVLAVKVWAVLFHAILWFK